MIISLDKVRKKNLQEYIDNFDINENVAIWWENGQPGRGVPFDNQGEQVADYEEYLAGLRDIIDRCRGNKGEVSNVQQLAIDNFLAAAKELELQGVTFTYNEKSGFEFKKTK